MSSPLERTRIQGRISDRTDDLERESRLQAIFASLAEGLTILDLEGKIIECNASAERILGLSRDQILGRVSRDPRWRTVREDGSSVPVEDYPSSITLRTGEPQTGVVFGIHRPDGSLRWVSVNSQPLRSSPAARPEGVIVSFADITAMRRMGERLLEAQKLESVARLAGGIAHDFNNLLTAVLSYAELGLAHVEPTSTLASYLTQIISSGDQAADLTRQLLAFASRQPARPTRLDLGLLLTSSLDILRACVGGRVVVELGSVNGLWPVLADRGQMQQVLLNLASNASDAMPAGGSLRLSVRNVVLSETREVASGDYVELIVTDGGQGMSPEVLAHVFEPFYTTKEIGQGSGLGLATCYGIICQHRGSIAVRSALGEGATITIRLPRASSSDAQA